MTTSQQGDLRVDRRTALKITAGAGLAAAGSGWGFSSLPARAAATTTLAIWTGFPELVPFYQAVADAYGKLHPEVGFTFFSTSLREAEQKLSAAVPTGTGPDLFDIGTNISVNFIAADLIKPNEAGDRSVSEERRLERLRGRLLHPRRQELWPAADGGQPGVDVL